MSTESETPDQRKMRELMGEIQSLMTKADVGGFVSLVSKGTCTWQLALTGWSRVVCMQDGVLGVVVSSGQVEQQVLSMHFVRSLRQTCGQMANATGELEGVLTKMLDAPGDVERVPSVRKLDS